MPNYSLILDAKFKPFSYDELIKPALMQTQAHQAIEEEYGNLATKASVWEGMANEQTDPYAYKMYKTYSNDLEEQANQLAREGLNAASRRGMLNMRARYSKEIVPIENAYRARAEEIKEQLAGRAQGMVYEGDASTASLDRYLKDPSIKFRYANSQEGYKRVFAAADALSKELRDYRRGKKLDPYVNTWLQQHGYQSSEIAQAITDIESALRGDGNARGTNVLTSILANEMQTAGVNDWNTNSRMDYYNRIAPALYKAVGQTNVATFEDYGAKLSGQIAAREGIQNRSRMKMYNINPTTFYGASEIANRNKQFQDKINTWVKNGWITRDGRITPKGYGVYEQGIKTSVARGTSMSGAVQTTNYTDFSFRDAINSLSPSIKNVRGINTALSEAISQIASGEQPVGTLNIDVYRQSLRDKTTQDYILNKTTAAIGSGKIYEAESVNQAEDGSVSIRKGSGITAEELRKKAETSPILYIINSPVSNNQLIELTDGTKYIMPKGMLDNINQSYLDSTDKMIRQSTSPQEAAVLLNRANFYLGSLLNFNEGTGVSTNEGTITFSTWPN